MSSIYLPRGPIYGGKSESDHEDNYVRDMLSWRESALAEAMEAQSQHIEFSRLPDYLQLIQGDAWHRADTPIYRSKFYDNRISKVRVETIAYLTDIRPTMDVTTLVEEYQKQADIIRKVIHYEWSREAMDLSLAEVIDHALLGTGYWKIGAFLPGQITATACGIDSVLPIQEGKSLQDSTAILYRTFKPIQYFKNLWPDRSEGIEKEAMPNLLGFESNQYTRPFGVNEYTWNTMSPAMRYHMARRNPKATTQDLAADFPVIELQEYWVEDWTVNETGRELIVKDPYLPLEAHNYWYTVSPGERMFPRKRLIIFAGERVMYDGPSPYWHGLFPFAKLQLNPIVWGNGGLSKYRDIVPLNKAMNDLGAGILDVSKRCVNPQLVTKDGAVPQAAWDSFFPDMPGGKLRMTPVSNPTSDVRYLDPPQLPAAVVQFMGALKQSINEQSGAIDVLGMGKKKQMPSGDSIEQMRDSMQTPYRLEGRYVERFLQDAGEQAKSHVIQFFTAKRRMKILGPSGLTDEDFNFDPGSLWSWSGPPERFHQQFSTEIKAGSLHGSSKREKQLIALRLATAGMFPIRELYRLLEVENADGVLAELGKEKQAGLIGAPKGRQPRTRKEKDGL